MNKKRICAVSLVLLFLAFSTLNCLTTPPVFKKYATSKLPIDSFIFISKKIKVEICLINEQGVKMCEVNNAGKVGSGFVVITKNDLAYVMTAAHVCGSYLGIPDMFQVTTLEENLELLDMEGRTYQGKVVSADEIKDICLIEIENTYHLPRVKLSSKDPKIGDKILNIAAPAGVYQNGAVPIYEGYYSGILSLKKNLSAPVLQFFAYSIYAMGGSSGSMVLNERGELIGLIHSRHPEAQVAIGPKLSDLESFLKDYFLKK